VIRPFGIVHTGIVLDDYVTSTAGLSLSIAGALVIFNSQTAEKQKVAIENVNET
jgi:hypothetical protein